MAGIAEGEVEGDAGRVVSGVRPLDEAGPDDLSFVAEARYFPYIHASRARVLVVTRGSDAPIPGRAAGRYVCGSGQSAGCRA